MREELIQLADTYLKAGEAIHDAIRESIRKAGGFLNCSNNDQEKKDMNALVSSVGATPKSKIFYTRMKGELEEAVKKLGFPACFILQPPSLVRKGSDRFGEKAGVVALRAFNAIGLMRAYKPMPTEEVAAAMVRLAKSGRRATETIVAQDILKA